MKTKLGLIVFVSALFIVLSGCASKKTPEQIALEKVEQQVLYHNALTALTNQDFVIEADKVTFRNGGFSYVNPNTNFVSVKGDKSSVQLAFSQAMNAGPNGLGGITLDGTVSNVKTSTDKKGNTYYTLSVTGIAISAVLNVTLYANSHQCQVVVNPNFSGNRITFTGYLYPSSESRIFKGRSI